MNILKDKKILITGGTGSFGSALLKKIKTKNVKVKEIKIFSRDEKKQDDLRREYNDSKIKFIIGDVRDQSSLRYIMNDIDFVFHAAALKQVPSCEFYPMEAIKTNIEGTNNVIDQAINSGVKKVVCLSTDKAVYPINAMGMSKALMEKIAISRSIYSDTKTKICVTRYGNVVGSRGSVIPLIIQQIKKGLPLTITNPNMSRFLMTLDDAMDLVLYAFDKAKSGQILVKKAKSTNIINLANALIKMCGKKKYPVKYIGTRHGEKIHETLISSEEKLKSKENKNFFIIDPDDRNLNYEKFFSKGTKNKSNYESYSSNSNKYLTVQDTVNYLSKIEEVIDLI